MLNNFKQAMQSPFDVNPLTRLWRILDSVSLYIYLEYIKLAKIVVVMYWAQFKMSSVFLRLVF
jgi:hypothetical protein